MEKSISFSSLRRLGAFSIAQGNSNLKPLFTFSQLGTEVNSNIFRMIETASFVIITTATNNVLGSHMWSC